MAAAAEMAIMSVPKEAKAALHQANVEAIGETAELLLTDPLKALLSLTYFVNC